MAAEKEIIITSKVSSLLEAADILFKQFGLKKVSIEEICSRANVSKMTFYKNFRNKDELISFIMNNKLKEGFEKFEEIDEMKVPFVEKIYEILKLKEVSSKDMSRDFVLDYLNGKPELSAQFQQIFQKGMDRFKKFITDAQAKGEVRKDLKPEFFLAVVELIFQLAKNEKLVRLYPTYQDFVMEVNKYLYFGLMPVNYANLMDEKA